MANVKITTGQYVNIEERTASVSDRLFAQIIDLLILQCYILAGPFAVNMLFHDFLSLLPSEKLWVLLNVVLMLPVIFYHPILEFFFNGASLGKKLKKLRVVHVDGSSPTLGSYLMRWMMYLLECMMMPGIALLCIIFSKKGQRLGDMMAGTIVIKTDANTRSLIYLNNFGYVNPDYRPYYPEVATMSIRQAEVVQETLMNTNSNRQYYIDALSHKIMDYLSIPPLVNARNEQFLNTVLNDYRYYSSTIEI